MDHIVVAKVDINETAADKMWNHGVTTGDVEAMLANDPVVTRNRKHRAAPYVLIGRDDQGRCLAVPILPTHDPYVWRAITAWECKPSEAAKLR